MSIDENIDEMWNIYQMRNIEKKSTLTDVTANQMKKISSN